MTDSVLHQRDWFRRLAPHTMYEADFEAKVRAHRRELFPDWHLAPFGGILVHAPESGYGPRRPDFALVHLDYLSWWVVEVELAHHSLANHVEPQVAVFAHGRYDAKHARYLAERNAELDPVRLERLVTQVQPRTLVIVNDAVPGWKPVLASYGCEICTIRTYLNDVGQTAYLVEGNLPHAETQTLSVCRRVDAMPKCLLLENPAVLGLSAGQIVEIGVDEGSTRWQFTPLGNHAFLLAAGNWPLSTETKEVLLCRSTNRGLHFIVPTSRKQRG